MLTNYLKIALKVLRRRKFFTFISLFGITLTLVVLMVAAALLDNAFAPRQPESRFDRVLGVYVVGLYGEHGGLTSPPGYGFLDKYLRGLPGAEATSFFTDASPLVMHQDGRRIETHLRRTDGAYWRILDFKFLEGGPYTEADNQNAKFVAVITDDMRAKLFGGKPAAGRTIDVDGQRFRIVGVVPAVAITRHAGFSEIWAPIRTIKTREYERQMIGTFGGIVMARSSADFPKMREELRQRLTHFVFDDPKAYNRVEAGLDTQFEFVARNVVGNNVDPDVARNRPLILRAILAVMALLFVTLPTVNLVSINLSRIMERASEIGVRKAFGASSRTLIGQFVMENVLLTVLGGTAAFVLATWVLAMISKAQLVPYAVFDVNLRIFLYGMLLAALFGIVSGVYPAWRMARMHPVNALRGGGQ
jgi:putative ABC transport system permease protein